jgi:hypothetical protein
VSTESWELHGQLGGQVVDVPVEDAPCLSLALTGANPCRGGSPRVTFTLPGGTPASLELLDVTGRRLAGWDVGTLGAGRHALDLGAGRTLAPGVHLVRLRQGSLVRTARAAVSR